MKQGAASIAPPVQTLCRDIPRCANYDNLLIGLGLSPINVEVFSRVDLLEAQAQAAVFNIHLDDA